MGVDVFGALFPNKEIVNNADGSITIQTVDADGNEFDYYNLEESIYGLTVSPSQPGGNVAEFIQLMKEPYIRVMKALMMRYKHTQELKHG